MIKSLNSNKHWCNPPTPERKKKKNIQNKTSKNGKKERRGEEREEKGRSNSDYSFERKTVLTCARDKINCAL